MRRAAVVTAARDLVEAFESELAAACDEDRAVGGLSLVDVYELRARADERGAVTERAKAELCRAVRALDLKP